MKNRIKSMMPNGITGLERVNSYLLVFVLEIHRVSSEVGSNVDKTDVSKCSRCKAWCAINVLMTYTSETIYLSRF
jgi:hypothetical protein